MTDWTRREPRTSISVVDSGAGIRKEDAHRLFEPFFSTKSTKGTGMGLWISKGIAQKYDGRISYRSYRHANGCITCFRVLLPVPAGSHCTFRCRCQRSKPGRLEAESRKRCTRAGPHLTSRRTLPDLKLFNTTSESIGYLRRLRREHTSHSLVCSPFAGFSVPPRE